MNWLKRLKSENGSDTDATNATKAPNVAFVAFIPEPLKENDFVAGANVAFVASVPGHIENSMMAAMVVVPVPVPVPDWAADPANDSTVGLTVAPVASLPDSKAAPAETIDTVKANAPDPDRWCYPHSNAMTGKEVHCLGSRLVLFMAKGLTANEAEALADKLVTRDRDSDDRRACLECQYLSGWAGRRQCRGSHHAGMAGPLASAGQVATLHRCGGFKAAGHHG